MNAKILATAMALTLVIVTTAFTQSQPTTSEQIGNLQRQVEALEARVARLEAAVFPSKQGKEPPASFVPVDGGWREASNWEKIKTGMSESQVTSILGKPSRKEVFTDTRFVLYFEGYAESAKAEITGNIFFEGSQVTTIRPPVW